MCKRSIASFICISVLAILSSCVNSDYDLDKIDTTARLDVNDLTIPINIDNIKLDKVLNLDEEGQVKKVQDPVTGEYVYAVVQSGSFESKAIDIPAYSSEKPETELIETELIINKIKKLDIIANDSLRAIAKKMGVSVSDPKVTALKEEVRMAIWNDQPDTAYLAKYPIGLHFSTFDTPKVKMHKAIRSIDNVGVSCVLSMEVNFANLGFIDNARVTDVKLQLPKGLEAIPTAGTYDSVTGILDLTNDGEGFIIENGKYSLSVELKSIDFTAPDSGAKFTVKENGDGEFYYSTLVKILSGNLNIYKNNFVEGKTYYDLPRVAKFVCDPEMTKIDILTFTGNIKYSADGIDAKSIGLSDIPDVLNNEATNIFLDNPQVYLSVNDPLADDGIYAEANVELTPMKNGEARKTATLDNGTLHIAKAENMFCLSPSEPNKFYEGWSGAQWMKFSGLSEIVSGKGLPDKINVNILNPGVPEQHVTNFRLGQNFAPIHGDYLFFAPLALNKYSLIVYEDKETGWNEDGSLDDLVITGMKVKATVSSDLPLGATLTLVPLSAGGEVMSGVEFSTVKLEPNKPNQEFTFELKSGTIQKLDGVQIRASIASDGSKALQPAQQLQLDNVRVTVSGHYQDEF